MLMEGIIFLVMIRRYLKKFVLDLFQELCSPCSLCDEVGGLNEFPRSFSEVAVEAKKSDGIISVLCWELF